MFETPPDYEIKKYTWIKNIFWHISWSEIYLEILFIFLTINYNTKTQKKSNVSPDEAYTDIPKDTLI